MRRLERCDLTQLLCQMTGLLLMRVSAYQSDLSVHMLAIIYCLFNSGCHLSKKISNLVTSTFKRIKHFEISISVRRK